jgi:hypothetical protein
VKQESGERLSLCGLAPTPTYRQPPKSVPPCVSALAHEYEYERNGEYDASPPGDNAHTRKS